MEFSTQFTERWNKDVPSAVKCLQNSLDSCLTFFDFPEEEWISLRTTNVIERLNKEFKRRTKPDGDHCRRECLLYPVSFYQHQNGNVLAVEPCRESALQSPLPS